MEPDLRRSAVGLAGPGDRARAPRGAPGAAPPRRGVPARVRRRDPDARDAQDRAVSRAAMAPARGRAGLERAESSRWRGAGRSDRRAGWTTGPIRRPSAAGRDGRWPPRRPCSRPLGHRSSSELAEGTERRARSRRSGRTQGRYRDRPGDGRSSWTGSGWEPTDEPHPSEGDVLAAGRLRFGSGRAVLSMLTGVVLDVEGPADVELVEHREVVCHRGRIRARVPAGARVPRPGAEFGRGRPGDGVRLERRRRRQDCTGQVFKGRLEAALLNRRGYPSAASSWMRPRPTRARRSRSTRRPARSRPSRARRTSSGLRTQSPPPCPGRRLPAAILRSRPWGYWRFKSLDGGAIPNEIPGRPPLQATGPIRLAARPDGIVGPSSVRPGPAVPGDGRALASDLAPGYAVEFWCLSESIGHASLVSLVAPGYRPPRLPHGADVAEPADDPQTGLRPAAPPLAAGLGGGR